MVQFKAFHIFCGIGGGALGFQQAKQRFENLEGEFRTLGGIDADPRACDDFEYLTGVEATCMDLFERRDYIAFHGCEPGGEWHEVQPDDIRKAAQYEYPDMIFLSPPCKGFSGLLPSKTAETDKYQALNRLVVRGLFLSLEAFKENPPALILLENVPRIASSRGEKLLHTIKGLLKSYGYVVDDRNHDCGELGGLAQHRRRYLLIARHETKIPNFVYQPPKQRVRAIGEVLSPLPLPDNQNMGPMHRLPKLQWKTWVRLALIPAGGDWRDLEKIAPEDYRLEYVPRGGGPYGVQDWNEPSCTVIGNAGVKGSNAASIADPRLTLDKMYPSGYGVQSWDNPSQTVRAAGRVMNAPVSIADPRLTEREGRHPGVYRVVKFDEPSPCVTGTRFGSGAPAIADPRLPEKKLRFQNKYQLLDWDNPASTVTGIADIQSGAQSISDPRTGFKPSTHTSIYQVNSWEKEASTVTGALRPNNGAISIADPRFKCSVRNGTMGVQAWEEPGKTVTGSGDIHSGSVAVADPRIPKDNESGNWIIISLDGTRHRPLTTLELAVIQGFPVVVNGKPLKLAGNSDARWREAVGNAVPPPAGRAMGEVALRALLIAVANSWELSNEEIWVAPKGDWEEIRAMM